MKNSVVKLVNLSNEYKEHNLYQNCFGDCISVNINDLEKIR